MAVKMLNAASTEDLSGASLIANVGSARDETVKKEVFRSENADGSIVIKTVRTTTRTEMSSQGDLVTIINVETITETGAITNSGKEKIDKSILMNPTTQMGTAASGIAQTKAEKVMARGTKKIPEAIKIIKNLASSIKPKEIKEVTNAGTTGTTVIVGLDDEIMDKEPKSEKKCKPKRQPSSETTEGMTEVTEVTEVTTETVEVL
ncbi:uncharacterized protein PHALS_00670, partial [Plasmopara halstedii]